MGSTPGSTKLGLVGGATKTDVSSCVLDVATTEVSATPGSVDSAFGLETSGAPKGAESTLTPGLPVVTTVVSTTSGLADAQAGSDASWDPILQLALHYGLSFGSQVGRMLQCQKRQLQDSLGQLQL